MVLSVVAHELLSEGASDVDLVSVASLGSVDALSEVVLLFLRFDAFEEPALVHSAVGWV